MIHSIQYLRGVAAMMVVVFHLQGPLSRFGVKGDWPLALASGVDIFFVVSGFIMWTTTWQGRVTPGAFLRRRLVRIVPLYWFLTLCAVAVALVGKGGAAWASITLEHLVKSLLFVPSLSPVTHEMEPVLIPGWTLNYEMLFYLLFGASLLLETRFRAVAVSAILVCLVLAHPLAPQEQGILGFYTKGIMLEFAFGLMIGQAYTSGMRLSRAAAVIALAIGALGIAASVFAFSSRVLGLGVPAALIVLGAVMRERAAPLPRFGLLHHLGDASYSIYLSHGMVLSAFTFAWQRMGFGFPGVAIPLFASLALILVCLVGLGLYRWVERPFIAAFRDARSKPALAG